MSDRRQQLINQMIAHASANRGQLTARELSQQFDLSEPVVRYYCARRNIALKQRDTRQRGRQIDTQNRLVFLRQHASRLTIAKAAKELDVAETLVRNLCKRYNIAMKPAPRGRNSKNYVAEVIQSAPFKVNATAMDLLLRAPKMSQVSIGRV